MKKSVLSPAHTGFLTRTFARNRALYGGWSMDGTDEAAAKAATDAAAAEKAAADKATAEAVARAAASRNKFDAEGNDLGYPKDTPVPEMTDKEQAAYHRYHHRKHENRYKGLVGDRTPEQVRADLAELEEIRKQKLTPSEQAIAAAKEEGKKEAIVAERVKTATALFRGALESGDMPDTEIEELVTGFNVANFINNEGVDTTKITNFAKRFAPSGTDNNQQRTKQRDFGGGTRGGSGGATERGAGGKAEADRRFGSKK